MMMICYGLILAFFNHLCIQPRTRWMHRAKKKKIAMCCCSRTPWITTPAFTTTKVHVSIFIMSSCDACMHCIYIDMYPTGELQGFAEDFQFGLCVLTFANKFNVLWVASCEHHVQLNFPISHHHVNTLTR